MITYRIDQYMSDGSIKTVYMEFPVKNSSFQITAHLNNGEQRNLGIVTLDEASERVYELGVDLATGKHLNAVFNTEPLFSYQTQVVDTSHYQLYSLRDKEGIASTKEIYVGNVPGEVTGIRVEAALNGYSQDDLVLPTSAAGYGLWFTKDGDYIKIFGEYKNSGTASILVAYRYWHIYSVSAILK